MHVISHACVQTQKGKPWLTSVAPLPAAECSCDERACTCARAAASSAPCVSPSAAALATSSDYAIRLGQGLPECTLDALPGVRAPAHVGRWHARAPASPLAAQCRARAVRRWASTQAELVVRTLGALPELVGRLPSHVVRWGTDAVELGGDLACEFTVIVAAPSLRLHQDALLQVGVTPGSRAGSGSRVRLLIWVGPALAAWTKQDQWRQLPLQGICLRQWAGRATTCGRNHRQPDGHWQACWGLAASRSSGLLWSCVLSWGGTQACAQRR